MTTSSACPCGSGATFDACCGPFLRGERRPPTAEALMRSRYTAYVRGDVAWLRASWDPQTRPSTLQGDDGCRWRGLTILRCEAGAEGDREGVVAFIAAYEVDGRPGQLHEVSRFRRGADGRWLYVDGDTAPRPPVGVGRNAPCPCGSGRKFKKCCGGQTPPPVVAE